MKVQFVTTNKHKAEEVQHILKDFNIEVEQLNMSYEENHDDDIEEVAKGASKKLADSMGKPIVLEDTGLYFEAYNNFPGALPKFVFNAIGYEGIFRLLEGKSRKAYFKTVVGYCEPGKEPVLFEGKMSGTITNKVYNEEGDFMPYDKIFILEGRDKTISDMKMDEKNGFSQRGQAFRKFGRYVTNEKLENQH